jgi:flagellin
MVINTNVPAQSSARLLSESSSMLAKSLARLSSGSKIISPEDDAAGLAVSQRFDAQINRTAAARSNISNAVSFNQTQDGFLQKVSKALDRMSELSILSQDVTKSDADRTLYDKEFTELKTYITNSGTKDFNGISLFSSSALSVTTDGDTNSGTANAFSMSGVDLAGASYAAATGSSSGVSTVSAAATALTNVKGAIDQLAKDRAQIGANISRLNFTNEQLGVLKDNLSAANSRIKDVDVAEESTKFARYNILVQAGTAMLAQANSTPQSALRLLQ